MIIFYIFLGVISFLFLCLMRNNSVYESRVQFLFKTRLEGRMYDALPSYDEMFYNPKHWGRWTKAQWADYARKNLENEEAA